jgi:predicted  nucleic acid-binding Zn-ribbon protein
MEIKKLQRDQETKNRVLDRCESNLQDMRNEKEKCEKELKDCTTQLQILQKQISEINNWISRALTAENTLYQKEAKIRSLRR